MSASDKVRFPDIDPRLVTSVARPPLSAALAFGRWWSALASASPAYLNEPRPGPTGLLEPSPERPLRVLHVITRMIVGGAQENTMLSCSSLDPGRFTSVLLTGLETGSEGELHTESRARGVELCVEPSLVRRIAPPLDMVAILKLSSFMRRGRFDIVHTHSSKAGIVGRIAARAAGVPIVVHTVHGWGFNPSQPPHVHAFYVGIERLCAQLCDALVVVGTPNREEGLALGIGRPDQYRLIRSGIDVETYRNVRITRDEARRTLGIPPEAFVVGTVGRLSPQKAPLDLLGSFALVARELPEARLVLVGDGPMRSQFESEVARLGLVDRVHALGLRRDVPAVLRAFDVFALTSRWEGLPRVFPQAMAAGLPIVATRVNGASDAIVPGENGWLVESGDVDGFASRLLELARDPYLARRMGERGRSAANEYSVDKMLEDLGELYESLAKNGHDRRAQ